METTLSLQPRKSISNGMLGMLFFLAVEVMLFAGFISAYIINRSAASIWPPYGQPRLPVEVTFINTLVLLASGITLFIFKRRLSSANAKRFLYLTIILGSVFLLIQGSEWMKLIKFGLTTSSSLYGAFFYMIIGAHALHAFAGLGLLYFLVSQFRKGLPHETLRNKTSVYSLYWYFVVGIWPVLYVMVYLL